MQTNTQDPKEQLEFLENARKQLEAQILEVRGELAVVGSIDWWNARGVPDEVLPLIVQIETLQDQLSQTQVSTSEQVQETNAKLEAKQEELISLKKEVFQLSLKLKPAAVKSIKIDNDFVCIHCGKDGTEDEHEESCLSTILSAVNLQLKELSHE